MTEAGRLMAAEVTESGDTLKVGGITPLFGALLINGYSYDISADGQRILAIVPAAQSNSEPLTLVQNWTALLKN